MDQCLPSFVSNDLNSKIEVLLIDDGSPDESLAKAKWYEDQYKGIFKAVHKENGGHGSVINLGVKLAKGKYIKVVDGDDFVDTKSLEKLVQYLQTSNDDCVVTDYVVFSNSYSRLIKGKKSKASTLNSYTYVLHSTTYKRDVFLENNIVVREGCFYEDNEYFLFPLPFLKKIGYLPIPLYHYRVGQNGQSISQDSRWKHKNDLWLVYKDIIGFRDKHAKGSNAVLDIIDNTVSEMFMANFSTYLYSDVSIKEANKSIKAWEKEMQNCRKAVLSCLKYKKYFLYKILFGSSLAIFILRKMASIRHNPN